jgi:hypothetical protein
MKWFTKFVQVKHMQHKGAGTGCHHARSIINPIDEHSLSDPVFPKSYGADVSRKVLRNILGH